MTDEPGTDQNQGDAPAPAGLGTVPALAGVAIIMAGVTAFLLAAAGLGIEPYYMGFLFSLLFGAFERMDPKRFLPALLGALAGLANAAALHHLPLLLGMGPGLGLAMAITLAGTFCLLRGWLRIAINHGYILFLTVATIPPLGTPPRFLGMTAAVILGAVFMGALLLIGRYRRRHDGALP